MANQNFSSGTIDVRKLYDYVRDNDISKEQDELHLKLATTSSIAYVESLAKLNQIRISINGSLKNGNLAELKGYEEELSKLHETCSKDIDIYAKLKDPDNQGLPISKQDNESLIPYAMSSINKIIASLRKIKEENIEECRNEIEAALGSFDKEVGKFKENLIANAQKDYPRQDIIIIKDGIPSLIPKEGLKEKTLKEQIEKKLEAAGLSQTQIDFITHYGYQSHLYGAGTELITPSLQSLAFVVDSDNSRQVIKYVAYNKLLNGKTGYTIAEFDISSLNKKFLNKNDKFIPGTYPDISMKVTSNALNIRMEEIQSSNYLSGLPEHFTEDFERLERIVWPLHHKDKLIGNIKSHFLAEETRSRILKIILFEKATDNENKTFDRRDFFERVCQDTNIPDKLISNAVVEHIQDIIKRKLDNKSLDKETHQRINGQIISEIGAILPSDNNTQDMLKKGIPRLVLKIANNIDQPITCRKTIELWWDKLMVLLKIRKEVEINKLLGESFTNGKNSKSHRRLSNSLPGRNGTPSSY